MKKSTLKNLSFSELKAKHRWLSRMLYIVGAATLVCILVMLYTIIRSSGLGFLNVVFATLAVCLTVYLYRLSSRDSEVYEEMWMRKFQN
jgi:Ca2+/Na+ antiporter